MILKANEEFPYQLVSGRLPGSEADDYGKRLIALGRNKYKNAYEVDGKKYVTIENEEYEVCGIIGCKNSDYYDYKMVFNINCLGENTLKENGSIWISGTYHNIFSVADCLTQLGYRILNVITWQKTNPPVNISCRFFTYSTEFVIWARKSKKVAHKFNYDVMKRLNDGKQMTDVWRLPAIGRWEKSCGRSCRRSCRRPCRRPCRRHPFSSQEPEVHGLKCG